MLSRTTPTEPCTLASGLGNIYLGIKGSNLWYIWSATMTQQQAAPIIASRISQYGPNYCWVWSATQPKYTC
jgi:hypothetical protein